MPHASAARRAIAVAALLALAPTGVSAEENYERWDVQRSRFPSTGGGGIVIGEYRPVIIADRCVTAFTATEPNGTVHRNIVLFEAQPAQGGNLCVNGKWSAQDGSASGTTPYRVFFKDGIVRGAP